MLNNDFKELTHKYTRYKKQQKRSRNLKILFFILLAALAYYVSTLNFMQPTKRVDVEKNTTTQIIKKEENLTPKIEEKKPEINKHRLQVTTTEGSLEQLTKNQEKSKSYSATISLANYHYSKKEYNDAVKWAIAASKLNKSKARPWIVYAQSKLAVGKVDIAKKALELYLKKHKSQEAQDLLDKLNAI